MRIEDPWSPGPSSKADRGRPQHPLVALILLSVLLPSCEERSTPASPLTGSRIVTPGRISETFDLGKGKAMVFSLSLPRGGWILLDAQVQGGPAVDLLCLDEGGFRLFSAGNYAEGLRSLSGRGVVDWNREATVPPGTWYVVARDAQPSGQVPAALVIDAALGTVLSSLGSLKNAGELSRGGGLTSRIQLTVEYANGPRPPRSVPPAPLDASLDVGADQERNFTFEVPRGSAPGRLTGTWGSVGQSLNLSGASDDAIAAYEMRGPDGALLQSSQFSMSGAFDVWVRTPGIFSFIFSNKGFLHPTNQRVTLKGSYQPK